MDLEHTIDFETFYFYSLLENIKKKGQNTLESSLQSDLNDFVEFLLSGSSPLDSIEKLAHRQGTSDISIFFADIIERVLEYQPEKSLNRIDEYAHDFLEMFRELSKDSQWNEKATQDLTEIMQSTSQEYVEPQEPQPDIFRDLTEVDVLNFVHSQIFNQIRSVFQKNDPSSIEYVNLLSENIEKKLPALDFPDSFRMDDSLNSVVTMLEKLYNPPAEREVLKDYLNDFWQDIDSLVRNLNILATDFPEKFQEFCKAEKAVSEEAETAEEERVELLTDSVQKEVQPEKPETEISEEEYNLRYLLRDYMNNEIEILGREVIVHLDRRINDSQDTEADSVVLENLKVLKDLGQIHKYSRIESASAEMLSLFRKFFKKKQPVPTKASELFQQLLACFPDYIDGILNHNPEEAITDINRLCSEISDILEQELPAEKQITLTEKDIIQTPFMEVNRLFLDRLKQNFRAPDEKIADDNLRSSMINDIMHLHFWYGLLKVPGAQNILEVLRNWLSNPKQHDKIKSKSDQIGSLLSVLSTDLFMVDPEGWTEFLEILTLPGRPTEGMKIEKSIPAFRDVTLRHLEAIEHELDRDDLNFSRLNETIIPYCEQIDKNSLLIDWHALSEFSREVRNSLQNMTPPADQQMPEFRNRLSHLFQDIGKAIRRMPEKTDLTQSSKSLGSIVSDFSSAGEESPAQEEDTSEEGHSERGEENDDGLAEAFREEMAKYLDQLDDILKTISQDFQNSEALKELGNTLHTLKGSAQLMNKSAVVELAGPLENLTDLILADKVAKKKSFVSLARRIYKALRKILDEKKVSTDKILSSLNSYITKYTIEEPFPAESVEKPDEVTEISADEEKETPEDSAEAKAVKDKLPQGSEPSEPVVKLQESDPELLAIFRNETRNNLETLENSINLIEKFRYEKETLQNMDHAVHEIRSAAKMLGFTEIGDLMDNCEELVECLNRNEPENMREIIPVFRKSIQIIRDISEDYQVSQKLYDETNDSLKYYVEELKGTEVPPREKTAAEDTISADDLKKAPSDAMLQTYLQEGREYVEDMNFVLMKLEKDPANRDLIEQLMRTLHTLKGSSSMMFQDKIEKLLHFAEELVERVSEKSDVMTPEVFDQIFSVVDEVEYMLNSIADKGSAESKNFHQIIENLRENIIKYGGEPEAEKEVGESVESAPFQEEVQYQASELTKNEFLQKKKTDAHVRMHVKQIDSLLNEAAELVIYHNQFKTQINRYKGYVPKLDLESKNLQSILWHLEKLISRQQHLLEQLDRGDKGTVTTLEESQKINYQNLKEVSESLHRVHENFIQSLQGIKNSGKLYEEQLQKITRLSNSIHDEIIKARLVPIGLLFQRFQRPLRDLARKNKKKIRLIIEGENTELDRILADELYEPMLHIFRNALDHGIETPAERKKNGKPEEGLIRISAEQERNYVLISIEDDGRGINISDIREKIVERGLVNPEKAKDLTPAELYEFLMVPGFSTARKKGVLSGRGVGLDAVRNQIQKIKGDLRISSTPQQNTRFTIRVPFSITVTQAMLVEVNKNVYAIPLLQVEETVNISDDKLDLQDDGYYLTIRNSQVPVIPMGNLLDLRGESDRQITRVSQYPVIIVQDEGQKAALLVDKILHREEILIKSLGGMLQGVKYIMGGSILADGQVVLVLDIPQIVFNTLRTKEKSLNLQPRDFKKNEKKQTDTSLKRTLPKRIIEGRKPKILIVDDSLSIRKFLSSLLSKHNYEVEAAPNGQSAIESLSQTEFDAVITDLEMPQLSGYDLIEHIRSDSRWDDLPVLVLTGRAGKNIEQQTLKLGANDFIIKPFKEKELLDKLKNFIERNE